MTDTAKVVEIDCSTGESIERDMTPAEIADLEELRAQMQAAEAERVAAEQEKADLRASAIAKLAAFGITEEEAVALSSS